MKVVSAINVQARPAKSLLATYMPYAILLGCCLFNFILAVVNNFLFSISFAHVALAQLAISAMAIPYCLIGSQRLPPIGVMAISMMIALMTILVPIHGHYDLGAIYDLLVIPLFLVMGAGIAHFSGRFLWLLLLFVFSVAVFEWQLPQLYVDLTNPYSYYSNTRGWLAGLVSDHQQDQNLSELGFYISSIRPNDSYFGHLFGSHRIGSVFLEPLSLGYFAIICFMALNYYYDNRISMQVAALILCLLLAMLSDTRVAVFLILLIFFLTPVLKRLPFTLYYFIPAAYILMMFGAYFLLITTDSLGGLLFRLSITVDPILDSSFSTLFFGNIARTELTGDSGFLEVIFEIGLLGLVLHLSICTGLITMVHKNGYLVGCALLYILTTATFGGAYLSIKTAALFAIILGAAGVAKMPKQSDEHSTQRRQ